MILDDQAEPVYNGNIIIFEIYLNNYNNTATHIDLAKGDFSYYTANQEVLLMPMFTFQVTNIRKETKF